MQSTANTEFSDREFPMTGQNYSVIQAVAYEFTGIKLSDHKKNMVYGRLARRLRSLKLASFDEYCQLIRQDNSPEKTPFVNAITTNLTAFFRENHHFEYLKRTVLPELMRKNISTKRIRIWSAGCSTGEEAYSIAMVVRSVAALSQWDVKILASDLDTNVVMRAQEAVYSSDRAEKIPAEYERFIQKSKTSDQVRVRSDAASLVTFKQLNLLHAWPMKGPFDVIFCRNVVIYFDTETQIKLFDRYANLLDDNTHLFIGHSENLHNVSTRFESVGRTIYRKVM